MVVELGDDDLVARRPRRRPSARAEVEGERGHVGAEGDLVGRGAEEVGERLAGARRAPRRSRRWSDTPSACWRCGAAGSPPSRRRPARHLRAAGAVEVGDGQARCAGARGRGKRARMASTGEASTGEDAVVVIVRSPSRAATAPEHGRRRDAHWPSQSRSMIRQRTPGMGASKRLNAMSVSLAPKAMAPERPRRADRAGVPGLPTRAAARHIMVQITTM